MGNFKSTFATDNRVESTIHFVNRYIRMKTNQIKTKKVESDFFVMSGDTVEAVIKAYQNRNAKTALVIGDLGLQITNRLLQEGVTDITVALVRLPVEHVANVRATLKRTFPSISCNIISMKELEDMSNKEFDLVIANPPYGKIGANITKKVIDTVDFKEYINLLPANDYKRNDSKDLFNYQSDMVSIKDGFVDAAVTTHLAKIHKSKVNNMTLDEFERSQYIDRQLDKYFEENSKRTHYAIDAAVATMPKDIAFDSSKSIFINHRDGANRHLAYSKNCAAYSVNVLNRSYADTFEDYGMKADKYGRLFDAALINFNTIVEKQNAAYFMYSINGFKFISKLFNAINTDSWVAISVWFPKVDWTRSWTVEEILADYGYTEDETKAVMEDLVNYKGMED